ncbi:MAG: peptide-methionine (S)-S-oxide reductase MsrA [Rickettsiales bacterium]|nr:peptide-methionine (S)-S-oxide reductase MsrA [Rickettsiales bacterium]
MAQDVKPKEEALAILAGGCFWCLEPPYEQEAGVAETIVGYTGGQSENPTYEQIGTGRSGHREAVAIHYNPSEISYERLLEIFFETIDPFDPAGQFVDKGPQYTTAIHYKTDAEKKSAEAAIAVIEKKSGKKVATVIEPAVTFYPAEEYHQDYYKKNPVRYKMYKVGSGR